MSENTSNKKRPASSGKKSGSKPKSHKSGGASGSGASGVNLKKKNRLAGKTVEMSSGRQISIDEVMNESDEIEAFGSDPPQKRKMPKPVKNDEQPSPEKPAEEKTDVIIPNEDTSVNEQINWKKQVSSIVIWMVSVILLALTFFPGESLWTVIHSTILGVLGFKAFLWAGLLIYFGYLLTKQKNETQIMDIIRPTAGIILLTDVLGYILIQSNGYRNVYNEISYGFFQLMGQIFRDGSKMGGTGLLGGTIGELLIFIAGKNGAAIIASILLLALIMVLSRTGPVELFEQVKRVIKLLLKPQFYKSLFNEAFSHHPRKTVFDSSELYDEYDDSDVFDVDVFPEEQPQNVLSFDQTVPEDVSDNNQPTDGGEADISENTEKHVSLKKKNKKLTKAEEIQAESQEFTKQVESGDDASGESDEKEYVFPPIRLLIASKNSNSADDGKERLEVADKLIQTLSEYNVNASVSNISPGPTVTRYEIKPAPGVKISKIKGLSDDIAMHLAAQSIRIEAPIPGKTAVGIEVPNRNKQMVRIREILGSPEFAEAKGSLTVALGKNIEGNIVLCDLSKMPHLLIAGSTGSGKSVCVNSMLMSLLYKYSPKQVKMVLIDPKSVEFDMYNGIPHLLVPVVCEPKKAAGALQWAVSEMLKRYDMLKQHGVRNIDNYNRLAERTGEFEKLCRIVIVIDEMADLMIASPKEVEDAIFRLAAMARAAGMHMVLATQRPSVDVITGTIKNNIPSRIALSVSSQVDSRTILDEGGAENLIGYGDMLYHPITSNKHTRVQGCFVDDAEVDRVIKFVKQNGVAEYDDSIADEIERNSLENSGDSASEFEGKDEYFEKAVEIVTEAGQASTSMLQRRLTIGYPRAGRIISQLEEHGIIGPHEGSKPRAVLITRAQWLEMTMNRTHAGKNDPILRSHSEFAAQTLDNGHEEITARQSEFFNADVEDDFDDNLESDFSDVAVNRDPSEQSDKTDENAPVNAQTSIQSAQLPIEVDIEETNNSDSTPIVRDFTQFITDKNFTKPVKPKDQPERTGKQQATSDNIGAPTRDFSIFFDDDEEDVITNDKEGDCIAPANSGDEETQPSSQTSSHIDDIPPWEEPPSATAIPEQTTDDFDFHSFDEPEPKAPAKAKNSIPDEDDDLHFFGEPEPKAPAKARNSIPDEDDDDLHAFGEPSGKSPVIKKKIRPRNDDDDLHSFDEPDARSFDKQSTVHNDADVVVEDEDSDDDIMSSPWIKKL